MYFKFFSIFNIKTLDLQLKEKNLLKKASNYKNLILMPIVLAARSCSDSCENDSEVSVLASRDTIGFAFLPKN